MSRPPHNKGKNPEGPLIGSEFLAALILSAAALAAHILYFRNAGALWRDEVNSLRIATAPDLGELWGLLTKDSFPVLSFLAARLWMVSDWARTDAGARAFGLLIGFGLLASLWIVSRQTGKCPPALSLSAFALFPLTVQVGDYLRPYGLGTILALLCFGSVWRLSEKPSAVRAIQALCVSVLASQCLYQNIIFAAAAGAGGLAVTLADGNRRRLKFLALALLPAPLSLLPYWTAVRDQQIAMGLEEVPFDPVWIKDALLETLNSSHPAIPWLWGVFLAAGVITAFWSVRAENGRESRDYLPLFCVVSVLTACAGYILYLNAANSLIFPRYFLPLLGFVAVALEALYSRRWWMRVVALVLAASFLAANVPALWRTVHTRQTNVDRVADYLHRHASPDDMIIVTRWYYGVGFSRYYDGPADWNTMPPLADFSTHRYDLFRKAMAAEDPVKPLLEQTQDRLNRKGNVWIVGGLPELDGNAAPPPIPPAPHPETGWRKAPYLRHWGQRVHFLLRAHGLRPEKISLPDEPVSDLETMTLDCWKRGDESS